MQKTAESQFHVNFLLTLNCYTAYAFRDKNEMEHSMKTTMAAAAITAVLAAGASKTYDFPPLPDGVAPFPEVATNVALHVEAEKLETFSLGIQASNCVSNEVLIAVGHDADSNGDLSFDETSFVFGMDCGARYLVDYDNGTVDDSVGATISILRKDFNPAWNIAKVVKRGSGSVGEVLTETVGNRKFTIIFR